jgi:peptidoglycan/LPS O-acetylase OafA/YrhL
MTDRGRIEWLDFLRGIAALAVVLFHVRVVLWVGLRALAADDTYPALDRALAWLALPAPFLGTAVMLFFVVSGFAIHWPYSAAGSPFALQPYAVRRFFRIYPPYLAAVAITVAAEYLIAAAGGAAPSPVAGTLATALMVQNYVSPAGQMGANPSLWSLPVEVELYLVYPLLLWLWRLAGTTVVVALVGAASLAAAVAFAFGAEWTTVNFAKYWIVWMA